MQHEFSFEVGQVEVEWFRFDVESGSVAQQRQVWVGEGVLEVNALRVPAHSVSVRAVGIWSFWLRCVRRFLDGPCRGGSLVTREPSAACPRLVQGMGLRIGKERNHPRRRKRGPRKGSKDQDGNLSIKKQKRDDVHTLHANQNETKADKNQQPKDKSQTQQEPKITHTKPRLSQRQVITVEQRHGVKSSMYSHHASSSRSAEQVQARRDSARKLCHQLLPHPEIADERIVDYLSSIAPHTAESSLRACASLKMESVKNPSAYLLSVLQRVSSRINVDKTQTAYQGGRERGGKKRSKGAQESTQADSFDNPESMESVESLDKSKPAGSRKVGRGGTASRARRAKLRGEALAKKK